jgi:hypothetical protein
VADPHHHGIVRTLHLDNGKFTADVQWIKPRRDTDRIPVANLRRVTADTPSQPVLPKTAFDPDDHLRASRIYYGWDDGGAVIFNLHEAWWCDSFIGKWQKMSVAEAVCKAGVLTEQEFRRWFDSLPPLPPAAFRSGWRSPLI